MLYIKKYIYIERVIYTDSGGVGECTYNIYNKYNKILRPYSRLTCRGFIATTKHSSNVVDLSFEAFYSY